MADIVADGAAQIEPMAAPPREVATREAGAQRSRQPRGDGVRFLDLAGVGHLPEVDFGQVFGARCAFQTPFAGVIAGHFVG